MLLVRLASVNDDAQNSPPYPCVALGAPLANPIGQSPKPRTVLDYYLLLPDKYFEANKEQRVKWMLDPKAGAIVDVRNGYLRGIGDGSQMGIIVCLFKNHDGTYLIGVAATYSEDIQHTRLNFYRYVSGNFVDVTKAVLPVAPREELKYEMPRFGTTIKVTDQNRHRLYNLVWKRQRFRRQRPFASATPKKSLDRSAGQRASQLTSSGDS